MKMWLLSAAFVWTSAHGAGSADALLTRNPTTGSAPFVLFTTSSRVAAAPGVEARITRLFNHRLGVEAFGRWSRPVLYTTISSDFENATGTEARLDMTRYLYGGSLLLRLGDGRTAPFVFGGLAGSHEIADESDAPVSALEAHAGGGIARAFERRRVMFRADAQISVVKGRAQAIASAGVGFRF